ncbi:hypothetical protein [Flexithrix dorotheae]|nr:hypothetical protein [Flexithrix dorotheae]
MDKLKALTSQERNEIDKWFHKIDNLVNKKKAEINKKNNPKKVTK